MYVVRIVMADREPDFKAFSARPRALDRFKAARSHVVDENLEGTALFQVSSTENPRDAIEMVKAGKADLLEIYPMPMTREQAETLLADLGL